MDLRRAACTEHVPRVATHSFVKTSHPHLRSDIITWKEDRKEGHLDRYFDSPRIFQPIFHFRVAARRRSRVINNRVHRISSYLYTREKEREKEEGRRKKFWQETINNSCSVAGCRSLGRARKCAEFMSRRFRTRPDSRAIFIIRELFVRLEKTRATRIVGPHRWNSPAGIYGRLPGTVRA